MPDPVSTSRLPRALRIRASAVLRRLPPLAGAPLRIQFLDDIKDRHGQVHAGSFLRERRIAFHRDLQKDPVDFTRIFCHELFHFVWLRLGNVRRRTYEEILQGELRAHARGELGWSAEWRKRALRATDRRARTRRWREYVCESFCDTAAWLYSGTATHPEFTLADRFRRARRQWLESIVTSGLSI